MRMMVPIFCSLSVVGLFLSLSLLDQIMLLGVIIFCVCKRKMDNFFLVFLILVVALLPVLVKCLIYLGLVGLILWKMRRQLVKAYLFAIQLIR